MKWLMVEAQAEVHSKDKDCKTPLRNAAENRHLEVVKWLVLKTKAEVDLNDT